MRKYEVEIRYINLNKINGFVYTAYSIPDNNDKTEAKVIERALRVSDTPGKKVTFIRIREIPC